jgi:hypothetical protein
MVAVGFVSHTNAGAVPMQTRIIGLDIAKHVFQVHAVDAEGRAVAQVRLRRAQVLDYFAKLPPCLVGMEACATGSCPVAWCS